MMLHKPATEKLHLDLLDGYKQRLNHIEDTEREEKEEPFERSFLHNAIYLHNMWFEQLEDHKNDTESPLLEEILKRRDSNLSTFQKWMNDFARDAKPNGWAIWAWSQTLKTFVGFPIKSHDDKVPVGIIPILVIDCWEHAYQLDYQNDFDSYLDQFWKDINWDVIEARHHELATLLGYGIK